MNNIITHDWLINNGFKEYNKTQFDSSAVDHCYQKCYSDSLGKRYFIDVKHYALIHPYTEADLSGYEVSGQFYLKDSHNAVNMNFLDSDVNEVEEFIDKLFDEELLEHYELWEA